MDRNNPQTAGAFRQSTWAQLRWVAILGQYLSVFIAYYGLKLQFDIVNVLIVISLWALVNLAQQTVFARQLRINEKSTVALLAVDILELTIVLSLTGGLNNPFISLLIVPVILAATSLGGRALWVLISLSILAVLSLFFFFQPMEFQGRTLDLHPLLSAGAATGVIVLILFLSYFTRRIALDNIRMTKALAESEIALQKEHRLSSLVALVAAYAHELGTPLATIRLTANELLRTHIGEETRQDVEQILQEAKRSADILQSMGARGKADEFLRIIPFHALVEEAAAPHLEGECIIRFDFPSQEMIFVERSEAIIQALRNLVHNAAGYAREEVVIKIDLSDDRVVVAIQDDGKGFTSEILARLGEPYLRSQRSSNRPDYSGMGMGVFISKTLLERTGAQIQFRNIPKSKGRGALVLIEWPREAIEVQKSQARLALGENQAFKE